MEDEKLKEQILLLKGSYDALDVVVDEDEVAIRIQNPMFDAGMRGLILLLENSSSFQIRAIQKSLVELRLSIERARAEQVIGKS